MRALRTAGANPFAPRTTPRTVRRCGSTRIYAYGDVIGFGGYTALAAANGIAHPFWIATGIGDDHEVFTARVASRG
jgi:hypothetical protein